MNKQTLYTILFFTLLMALSPSVYAKDSTSVEPWDRSHVDYRPASAEKMEAYKRMPKFIYDRYEKPESAWEKVRRWLWSQILRSGINGEVLIYVLIGLAGLILLFVVLKLLGIQISGLFIFTGNNKVTDLSFKQNDDDIYNENLDDILTVAIKNKAYREAVRVMYLLILRRLDKNELIHWEPWKTNKEYYYELESSQCKALFKRLVFSYEYIWYGQFNIEEEKFQLVRTEFEEFEQFIHRGKKSA